MHTLVPGSVVFYLPEVLERLGLVAGGHAWIKTLVKTAVGCWLLWHALQLSDQETRHSRLHEPTLPAPGYLGRFIGSTLLFWGGLALALWPAMRILTGSWSPVAYRGLGWVLQPWSWGGQPPLLLAGGAVALVPAALWTIYGWFHGYYVADEGQGAWQSMLSSFKSVRGAFWRTTWFVAVIGAVNAFGLALWFVGIFIAFPITLMATTYVHLELKRQAQGIPRRKS